MKLIKFDTLYPADFVNKKITGAKDEIKKMDYLAFHQWLVLLRTTFSDYYAYNLSQHGWVAKEFFLDNKIYQLKCGKHYFGYALFWIRVIHKLKNTLSNEKVPFTERLIKKIIEIEKPNILFIREQCNIRSKFWEQFKNDKLIVSRMDCPIPRDWSPLSFDLIYSNMPPYINFFNTIQVKTLTNSNGIDERIVNEIALNSKIYDVSFIGGLGVHYGFIERAIFFENLIKNADNNFKFAWWGYKIGDFDITFPELAKTYMGECGGIDMFNIYAQSKIVLNYYTATTGGIPGNMRMYEAIGVGSFLLTRHDETLKEWKPFLDTYNDIDDCIKKINYYLINEGEREIIAKKGQKYILKNYNYKDLMGNVSQELISAYNNKFRI